MSEEIVNNQEEILEEETQDDTEIEIELDDYEVESQEDDTIDWEARAKKAEALLIQRKKQEKKQIKPAPKLQTNTLTEEAVEIKILKSQGKTEDEITQLRKIAKVNETSIFDALSDPYFVAWKEAHEKEAKANKAKLPSSKGSSSVRQSKDFTTRDLTDEEHKELWKQRQG